MLNIKSILLRALLLTALILAYPSYGGASGNEGCLTDQEAYAIIQKWVSLFQTGLDAAVIEQALTEDFYEQSGGFNFITAQNVRSVLH